MTPHKQAGHMTCTRPQAERQNPLAPRASSTHDPYTTFPSHFAPARSRSQRLSFSRLLAFNPCAIQIMSSRFNPALFDLGPRCFGACMLANDSRNLLRQRTALAAPGSMTCLIDDADRRCFLGDIQSNVEGHRVAPMCVKPGENHPDRGTIGHQAHPRLPDVHT